MRPCSDGGPTSAPAASEQRPFHSITFLFRIKKKLESRVRSLSRRFHDGPRQLGTPAQNCPRPGWRDFLRLSPASWPATNPRGTDHPSVGNGRKIWRKFFIFYKFFVRTSACIFNQQGRGIPFTWCGEATRDQLRP